MKYRDYKTPQNIETLFANKEQDYVIIDYNLPEMDNDESMRFFLDHIGVDESMIAEDYGTQVVVRHPLFDHMIRIDSGGLGDFYSHCFHCGIA